MNKKQGNKSVRFLAWVGIGLIVSLTGCAGMLFPPGPPEESGPYLTSTSPRGGEFGISPYASVEMRFSASMDPATENGFEMYGGGLRVQGALRWVDPTALQFRPEQPFRTGVSYQCILREGRSKDGDPLNGTPYIWLFTAGQ